MFSIKTEQITTLQDQSKLNFIMRMQEHVRECFPEHYAKLGSENTQELIETAIDKAYSHDIDIERDVCKFLNLMLSFGVDFDQNPECKWATPILEDPMLNASTPKIEALCDSALKFLKEKQEA